MSICYGREHSEQFWAPSAGSRGSERGITTPAEAGDALTITPMTGCLGVRLRGDVDLATAPVLEAALDELMSAAGDVHLDLAELHFVDLTGVAVLVAVATRLAPERSLVVHDPPPALNQIVETFWDSVVRIRVRVDVS